MNIVTESRTVFVLVLFDKKGIVINSERFRSWRKANSIGKKLLKEDEYASFEIIQKPVAFHGITISIKHW